MILFIDTTDFSQMHFALIDKTVVETRFEIAYNENWKTLEHLEKFLKAQKVSLTEISKILVCSGPGSFTGTRVGATIAQGLGFSKDIPVAAIPKNKIPDDLLKLKVFKGAKKLEIEYTSSKFD